jgi:hypothetical protein
VSGATEIPRRGVFWAGSVFFASFDFDASAALTSARGAGAVHGFMIVG